MCFEASTHTSVLGSLGPAIPFLRRSERAGGGPSGRVYLGQSMVHLHAASGRGAPPRRPLRSHLALVTALAVWAPLDPTVMGERWGGEWAGQSTIWHLDTALGIHFVAVCGAVFSCFTAVPTFCAHAEKKGAMDGDQSSSSSSSNSDALATLSGRLYSPKGR